ncbi:WXG100 family type VII secretion target [Herbiconiux sp. SYSU D00978]|uniref:WXG100 family type VII secretion target n=1 Tax=Herbiconiux sp. SYSU D00978 TaxID=2812562 RepID=UPI001A97A04B|nr:WXG100 family type VII secretion target [Herbiconiux sp. SYSU D00978]
MVQFRVRAASLGEVAAQLQTVVGVFDGNVASVRSAVAGTVNASWIGEDADRFAEEWAAWEAQAALVRAALTGLAAQLTAAEGSYTSTETGLSGGFASRRSANGGAVDSTAAVAASVLVGQGRADSITPPQLVGISGGAAISRTGGGQPDETVAAEREEVDPDV